MPRTWKTERILQLLALLHSGRYNSRQLAERLGVNRRTIFRDLATLSANQVPVLYDSDREMYTVRAAPPALPEIGPQAAETVAIALQMPLPGSLQELAWTAIGGALAQQGRGWKDVGSQVLIHLPAETTSAETFQSIVFALRRRQYIRVYTTDYITRFSPYAIAHVGRWYVIGRSSYHRRVLVQPVSEIRSLDQLDEQFEMPPQFRVKNHIAVAEQLALRIPSLGVIARGARQAFPTRLLTESHAAEYLSVTPRELHTWRERNIGPPYLNLGFVRRPIVRYDQGDLEAWVANRRVVPESANRK